MLPLIARKWQKRVERRGHPYRFIIRFSCSSSNNYLAIAVAMRVSYFPFLTLRCPFLSLQNTSVHAMSVRNALALRITTLLIDIPSNLATAVDNFI